MPAIVTDELDVSQDSHSSSSDSISSYSSSDDSNLDEEAKRLMKSKSPGRRKKMANVSVSCRLILVGKQPVKINRDKSQLAELKNEIVPIEDEGQLLAIKPKKKKKHRHRNQKILVNVSYCHYPVVRTCAKMNKFKITY